MKAAVVIPVVIILIIAASAVYLFFRAPDEFNSGKPDFVETNQSNPDKIEVNDTMVIDKNLVVGSDSAFIQ